VLAVVRAASWEQAQQVSAPQPATDKEVCQTLLVAISYNELPENVMFFSQPGESPAETPECGFPMYDILKSQFG
jgi:hypothetical protein